MRTIKIYSLQDKAAGIYNTPFFVLSPAVAERSFVALAQDLSTTVGQHPRDFVLYEIGSFNDQTGLIDPCEPKRIISGSEIADRIALTQEQLPWEEGDKK